DVALKLLKRFQNLPDESYGFTDHKLLRRRESFSLPNQNSKPVPQLESSSVKFSVLMELAKMPSVFPSGTQYGHLRQFIYNHLSVDRKFSEDYGITEITNFVQKVTSVDKRQLKTSTNRPLSRYDKVLIVLDFLATLVSGLHLWRILCEIAYLFGKTLKRLYGISEIYEQKCTHYQVIGILSYFSRSIGKLNGQQLKDAYAYEAMLYAAEHGIIEFINAMREAKPALLSAVNSCNRGIFSYAIQYRKQNVFQLIHCLNGRKEMFRYSIDTFGNNMLHLAAHLGPPSDRHSRSGAAMQMQREIQWFKAVEKVLHPKFKEAENDDGKKPYEIFTENHEELVKDGEKWAKDTATSYTIVGTLIITIMFAAAFTVPGGNDQNTGLPIFLHDNVFTTFLIADALSLFASATSVLIFIGILTSRYAEKDFVKNLPWKLMFGLSFLFLSVCSMIVAFCAAIIDMISKGYRTNKWSIIVLIMLLGSIPIIVLVLSQLRLMKEIIHSTWKNRISTIEG
ncbi:ankyrin-like protein, partial [Trifolium pratense]